MERKEVRKAEFDATDDYGKLHRLHARTTVTSVFAALGWSVLNGQGKTELFTANGDIVNRIDKGEYEIAATGIRLRSASPEAP